jgi:APA family basic amino acid/polyamine antiporter
MIGGGVFVFTGIVYKIAGPALPIAYGLAVIPVFISMMPLAMLGSAIPTTGARYRYPSRMVSPGLAFVGVWV